MNLRWNKNKSRVFFRKIRAKKFTLAKFKRGAYCCAFVPVSKKVAVKLYRDVYDRNYCHRMQLLAERHEMAPRTGEKFRVLITEKYGDSYETSYFYGFLTEIAQTDARVKDQLNEYDSLTDIYKKIGLIPYDLYNNNVGVLNGKLVAIDFSCFEKRKEVRRKVLEAA